MFSILRNSQERRRALSVTQELLSDYWICISDVTKKETQLEITAP